MNFGHRRRSRDRKVFAEAFFKKLESFSAFLFDSFFFVPLITKEKAENDIAERPSARCTLGTDDVSQDRKVFDVFLKKHLHYIKSYDIIYGYEKSNMYSMHHGEIYRLWR